MLYGCILGFYGYGCIVKVVVGYVEVFGMNVVWWGLEDGCVCVVVDGCILVVSCKVFFVEVDVVFVYVRFKFEIWGFIIVGDLGVMCIIVVFVNIFCVGLIESGVLFSVLDVGWSGYVVLDVFD